MSISICRLGRIRESVFCTMAQEEKFWKLGYGRTPLE